MAGRPRRVGRPARQPRHDPARCCYFLGQHSVAAFLAAVSSWPAFKILVACWLADDAKLALRAGQLNPRAGPTSLAELVAASAGQKYLSGNAAAGSRRHGTLDAGSAVSVPRWGSQPYPCGAAVREPGSGLAQCPDRAVAASLRLLPAVGLGGADRLERSLCSAR